MIFFLIIINVKQTSTKGEGGDPPDLLSKLEKRALIYSIYDLNFF